MDGNRRKLGFTLVELLAVIVIIAILLSMAVPGVNRVINSARGAQARTEVKSIETAVLAYYNEYGRFPHPADDDVSYGELGETPNMELMNVLRAVEGDGNPGHRRNARRILFLEVSERSLTPPGETEPDGNYRDPWGNQYEITIDADFNGHCENVPTYGTVENRRVVVWSHGRDDVGGTSTNWHIRSWD